MGMSVSHCEATAGSALGADGRKSDRAHCDEDPDRRLIAVETDDLDGTSLGGACPVLDRSPHDDGQAEAVGVAERTNVSHGLLIWDIGATYTTEVAAPRRVKS
jgi:hypothetical protein